MGFVERLEFASVAVGVLALLSALLVWLAALAPQRPNSVVPGASAPAPAPSAEVHTVKVPWNRASSKTPVYAAIFEGRVRVLDLRPVYASLARQTAPLRQEPLDFELPSGKVRFFPLTNEVYCFQFKPKSFDDAADLAARQEAADWRRTRQRYPAERYSYFFWVAGDSFEAFRALRERLRREGVEVRWKPVRAGAALEICQGMDGASGLQPQ
jgi:hypothetical protein